MPRQSFNANRANDWDPVTITRKKPEKLDTKSEQAVNKARRFGGDIETKTKYGGGANKHGGAIMNTMKLDNETENVSHKTVPLQVGKVMMQARQAKGLTQKDLATSVNEKPQVVQEIEQGKAVVNQAILGKLERKLGVKLRGKDLGSPLGPSGPKKK